MKVATAEQMRACDEITISEWGVPGLVLMENAGKGTVAAMDRFLGPLPGKKVVILVGPGNNGGDGLVIARLLVKLGAFAQVVMLVAHERLQGDAATNLNAALQLNIPMYNCLVEQDLEHVERLIGESDLVVDAIFGTGLTRPVVGRFAAAIACINNHSAAVVAVDIPSGLNSDTGLPLGGCVRADLTCTYGLLKVGQLVASGKEYVGRLELVDIGIPAQAAAQVGVELEYLDGDRVKSWLPERPLAAHKGTFGHLLVIAGSIGKSGAAMLCAQGALRAGTGLVSLAAPQDLARIFESALIEAMSIVLPCSRHCFVVEDYEAIMAALSGKKAVVMGPGLGGEESTAGLVEKIYQDIELPMVVDADGLNLLVGKTLVLEKAPAPRVLTPHPGEMARLCGLTTSEVQQNRLKIAGDFAKRNRVYLVLKGAGTVVAAPDGRLAINSTGNPGMAAGGMGDVLTGLIGGLLAQGVDPWQAACLGVYVHGLAADLLAKDNGLSFGYLAGEVAAALPRAFRQLQVDG
ncbi:MAG: NAD(P)H-hydrate dehydratase [Desulfobulbaceae bacterium]|nr:NAD(P)H-hydrate dehydratase [Desulfobulbaceae bacterium]HIJ78799.1 NAD(P)H-hydrate dehydratase [Deltaproteobacteria bacterium]